MSEDLFDNQAAESSYSSAELAEELQSSLAESAQPRHERVGSAECLDQLTPREVTDATGFDRMVYTFGQTELVFRGREELPDIPGFEAAHYAGATELPRFTDVSPGWPPEAQSSRKIVASQTPLGLIEAGIALGIQPDRLAVLQSELRAGEYSPETLDIIDSVVACRVVDGDGRIAREGDPGAEALVLLSLSGDEAAQTEVATRRAALVALDNQRLEAEARREQPTAVEPLAPSQLLLVHLTDYAPRPDSAGGVDIASTYDATNGAYVRNSIHFTLDHAVVGHLQGNWEGSKYAVVDTLESVMAAHGRPPASMRSSDTWFTQNPGEPLRLPTARVFEADIDHEGAPKDVDNTTIYNPNTTQLSVLIAAELATRQIASPGSSVSGHGWSLESPKQPALDALRAKLGVPANQHLYSPDERLAEQLGADLAFADVVQVPSSVEAGDARLARLNTGAFRARWTSMAHEYRYISAATGQPVDYPNLLKIPVEAVPAWAGGYQGSSSLNALLAQASPEARRCFYASGQSIPRITEVVAPERERGSRYG